jgi:hypothetical protein
MQNLVAGLAADPELEARLDHRQVASLHRHDELHPLVHRVGLGPGHPWNGPAAAGVVTCECYPCARTRVSPMYPGRTLTSPASFDCHPCARTGVSPIYLSRTGMHSHPRIESVHLTHTRPAAKLVTHLEEGKFHARRNRIRHLRDARG